MPCSGMPSGNYNGVGRNATRLIKRKTICEMELCISTDVEHDSILLPLTCISRCLCLVCLWGYCGKFEFEFSHPFHLFLFVPTQPQQYCPKLFLPASEIPAPMRSANNFGRSLQRGRTMRIECTPEPDRSPTGHTEEPGARVGRSWSKKRQWQRQELCEDDVVNSIRSVRPRKCESFPRRRRRGTGWISQLWIWVIDGPNACVGRQIHKHTHTTNSKLIRCSCIPDHNDDDTVELDEKEKRRTPGCIPSSIRQRYGIWSYLYQNYVWLIGGWVDVVFSTESVWDYFVTYMTSSVIWKGISGCYSWILLNWRILLKTLFYRLTTDDIPFYFSYLLLIFKLCVFFN